MASRPNITKLDTGKFISALLAPLPPKEERANSKTFIVSLTGDMKARWKLEMRKVEDALRARNRDYHSSSLQRAYFDAVSEQMQIPAPGRAALKWKCNCRKFDGGRPEWEAAIARDEAWIEEQL